MADHDDRIHVRIPLTRAWLGMALTTTDVIYREELGRPADLDGLADKLTLQLTGATADDIRANVRAGEEYRQRQATPPPVPPLEPWKPTPTAQVAEPLIGRLCLLDGGRSGAADDSGPRVVTLCHAGDLFARYLRDPEAARSHLDAIATAGYHGVRTWTILVGSYWRDRTGEISPQHTTGYWPSLMMFAAELQARGLRWCVSNGDLLRWAETPELRRAYLTQLAQTLGTCGELVIGIDAGNEAWQNGESNANRLADVVQAFLAAFPYRPAFVSLTSPTTEEDIATYDRAPATVTDVHSSRAAWPAPARRMFNTWYENPSRERPFVLYSEPGGVGRHVSARERPEEWGPGTMAVLAAVGAMGGCYTYMSSPGVISDEPFTRYPSFTQTMAIARLLPPDLGRFGRFHGGEDRAFSPDRILGAVGDVRCDHARDGNRYVVAVYGPRGSYDLPIINGFDGRFLCGDVQGLQDAHISLLTGERTLSIRLDTPGGFVLVGERR